MRLAILLGVAEYSEIQDLPACSSDARLIDAMLRITGQYDRRLCLDGRLNASDTKGKILKFLERLGDSIEEFLFFYSGHGDLVDNDLIFPLSDYTETRRHATSLENREVDNWIRNLNPKRTVKILDCCSAGISYIKAADATHLALQKSATTLGDCYFLLSSQHGEASYAGPRLSQFTEIILRCVMEMQIGPVRYKDLIDAIVDRYQSRNLQTPQFVVQAPMTEIFCTQTDQTIKELSQLIGAIDTKLADGKEEDTLTNPQRSLVSIVEEDASSCMSKSEAVEILKQVKKFLQGRSSRSSDYAQLYQTVTLFDTKTEDLPSGREIGKWILSGSCRIFAEPTYQEPPSDSFRVLAELASTYGGGLTGLHDALTLYGNPHHHLPLYSNAQRRQEKTVDGFFSLAGLEFDISRIIARPRHPNLSEFEKVFTFLWSRRVLFCFEYRSERLEENWGERRSPDSVKWSYMEFVNPEADVVVSHLDGAIASFEEFVLDRARRQFHLADAGGK